MNIPTIGGTRGIFEIFVPGVFLLINIGVAVYLFPYIDAETKGILVSVSSNSALALVVAICFGYLIGVLLRLIRADVPDQLSAAWLRRFERGARKEKGGFKLYATEEFPYFGWIEEAAQRYLPPEASEFYSRTWAKRKTGHRSKQFFNFCKLIVASCDEKAANEVYAAEALTRYIAGMFYALTLAVILLLVTLILRYIAVGQLMSGLVFVLAIYLLAILVIIRV